MEGSTATYCYKGGDTSFRMEVRRGKLCTRSEWSKPVCFLNVAFQVCDAIRLLPPVKGGRVRIQECFVGKPQALKY